jgi:hypothetical protein
MRIEDDRQFAEGGRRSRAALSEGAPATTSPDLECINDCQSLEVGIIRAGLLSNRDERVEVAIADVAQASRDGF